MIEPMFDTSSVTVSMEEPFSSKLLNPEFTKFGITTHDFSEKGVRSSLTGGANVCAFDAACSMQPNFQCITLSARLRPRTKFQAAPSTVPSLKSMTPVKQCSSRFIPIMSKYGGSCRRQLSWQHPPIPRFHLRRDLDDPPDPCLYFGYLEGA